MSQPTIMSEAEWRALGEQRFGKDTSKWRFACPTCGNVMSIQKARDLSDDQRAKLRVGNGWSIESECIGRYIDGSGCNWCAYGLFAGPNFVLRADGHRTPVFPFDPEEAA